MEPVYVNQITRWNIIVRNTLSFLSYDLFIFINKYKTILKAPQS